MSAERQSEKGPTPCGGDACPNCTSEYVECGDGCQTCDNWYVEILGRPTPWVRRDETEKGPLHNDYCWSFCGEEGRRFIDCDCPCHEAEHVLDTSVRPAACSCGTARFAGSPTFIRERHVVHVEEASDA